MQNDNQNQNFDILDSLDLVSENKIEETKFETLEVETEEKEVENTDFQFSSESDYNIETIKIDEIETIEESKGITSVKNTSQESIVVENEKIEETKQEVKNEKKKYTLLENIIFFIKYVTTSAVIFWVLLVTTNYSAYLNLAKSYIYADEMVKTQNSLLNSVEASKISKNEEVRNIIKDKKEERKLAHLKNQEAKKSKYSIKKLASQTNKNDQKLDIEITPYENRIVIPKIGKNIPLVDVKNQSVSGSKELEGIFMKELEKGVVRYPGSTKPGVDWNTFVFGHSSNFPWIKWDFNDVFALLDNVVYNDEIIK